MQDKMDVNTVLQKVDEYYSRNQGAEAEKLMQEAIMEAVSEKDDAGLLQLLNELLGYYRESGQAENSFAIAAQCIALAEQMNLQDSVPYATTLINVANAYRAGGRLEESLDLFLKVRDICTRTVAPDDMLVASLENNLSLLYQEMGRFMEAKQSLLRALHIVEQKNGVDYEVAVTHANLAASCMQIGEAENARAYAEQAIREFQEYGVEDSHYGAALSALGNYYFHTKEYGRAQELFEQAMRIVENSLGKNDAYYRLQENVQACRTAQDAGSTGAEGAGAGGCGANAAGTQGAGAGGCGADAAGMQGAGGCGADVAETQGAGTAASDGLTGMALCREFYEAYGRPMIAEKFPEYEGKIAVGLVGKGSDCFGYDDIQSRDHDWGPEFCMWVSKETFEAIGEDLKRAYEELPQEFQGYKRVPGLQERGRRGVFTVEGFFEQHLGASCYEQVNWHEAADYALANVANGEIFRDDEGSFTAERDKFLEGYPERILYLKMADSAARFSQAGQYNYRRMLERGDRVTAQVMLADAMREAMKLQHYIENRFPPHDKWLNKSMQASERGKELAALLAQLTQAQGSAVEEAVERVGAFLMKELYQAGYISDSDTYLDAHSDELARKASFAACTDAELVNRIAEAEFTAFDKVQNVGGRASCQNDWDTFSIMRKSQYLTWNRAMLMQYLYDFLREYQRGHNLIEEKYGRMMESTAPDEYEAIKESFPELTPEKKHIIEEIVRMQTAWMEEFAEQYPVLAENARSVHTSEDNIANTSYETYLRGEISTYSDKMLELYGRYVVEYAQAGRNLTFAIMNNSVRLYGYGSLDAAERFLAQ